MKDITEKFSSKANTLLYLQKKISKGKIEKIYDFTVKEWINDRNDILKNIIEKFYPDEIIIRSSAKGEDSSESSEAGKYTSIQKISTRNKQEIEFGINDVINTYSEQNNENKQNQVLIQKQTTGVITNGVVFTQTPDNGSPYYVINFSDSKQTDDVTKGETSPFGGLSPEKVSEGDLVTKIGGKIKSIFTLIYISPVLGSFLYKN